MMMMMRRLQVYRIQQRVVGLHCVPKIYISQATAAKLLRSGAWFLAISLFANLLPDEQVKEF